MKKDADAGYWKKRKTKNEKGVPKVQITPRDHD